MRAVRPYVVASIGLLAFASVALAAPGSGSLEFDGDPTLDGTLSGQAAGELLIGADDASTFRFHAEGSDVEVVRVFSQRDFVTGPTGGKIMVDAQDGEREDRTLSTLTLDIVPGKGFRALAWTTDTGQLVLPGENVTAATLSAFESPRLITDERGQVRDEGSEVFTYRADGARFHVEGVYGMQAEGSFSIFVDGATLTATTPEGEEEWQAGDYRASASPGTSREGSAWYRITFTEGTLEVSSDRLAPWLASPTLMLDGTVSGADASGEVLVAGDAIRLTDREVRLIGDLELRPEPSGTLVETGADRLTVVGETPTEGRYSGSSLALAGDVQGVEVGGASFDIPVTASNAVAAAGVMAALTAAVLAFSPKAKWAALSVLAPLYAKTQKDRILDNLSRDRIFQAIRVNPGVNLSRLNRISDLGWGVTVYHLKMLEKTGLVFSTNGARDRCFFENTPENRKRADTVSALANRQSLQQVARVVAAHPGIAQRDIVKATGMSQRAVSYSLKRLDENDLVSTERDGNFVRYTPSAGLAEALALVLEDVSDPNELVAVADNHGTQVPA
ncbi:MAG: winged helix DNA-binding protein [Euryarchaeota archaeon]|nr:winged helix DNA-binding protein [Euryarchaeota archaeon]